MLVPGHGLLSAAREHSDKEPFPASRARESKGQGTPLEWAEMRMLPFNEIR